MVLLGPQPPHWLMRWGEPAIDWLFDRRESLLDGLRRQDPLITATCLLVLEELDEETISAHADELGPLFERLPGEEQLRLAMTPGWPVVVSRRIASRTGRRSPPT